MPSYLLCVFFHTTSLPEILFIFQDSHQMQAFLWTVPTVSRVRDQLVSLPKHVVTKPQPCGNQTTYPNCNFHSTPCAVLSRSITSDSLKPHGLQSARLFCPWGFSRQEHWSEFSRPPPGDLPNPGIKPRPPALQVDSLPAEPPGKPRNTGVGSLSLLQGIFPTQESNQGLLHCRWILYQLSYKEALLPTNTSNSF